MPSNMNTVNLIGNLTRDPELKQLSGDNELCSMRIAFNTRSNQGGEWGDKANYIDVTVFGRQAGPCAQYLSRGKKIGVTGRLDWREWEDKDGNKRQAIQIIATEVEFLTPVGEDGAAPAARTGNDLPADKPADDYDDVPF
jgi:single-strand DNA-binding protein